MKKTIIIQLLVLAPLVLSGQSENVGIHTSTPSERLEVNDGSIEISSIGFTDYKGLKFSETSDPLFGWIYNGINNRLHLREYFSDSSDILSILSDGKVGIGTSSPSHWLELNRGNGFQFKLNNPGTGGGDWYIGASDDTWNMGGGKLAISNDGTSLGTVLMINANDDVGIGTTTPEADLHIHRPGVVSQPAYARFSNSITGSSEVDGMITGLGINENGYLWHNENEPILVGTNNLERMRISETGEVQVKENVIASKSIVFDLPGSSSGEGIIIKEASGDAFGIIYDGSGSGAANKLIFRDLVGTDTDVMSIYGDGKVQFGAAPIPAGYQLSIDGKMICEEVQVTLSQDWPDYVFDQNYELMPLGKLKSEIQQLHHLPGIPSAEEIEKQGIPIGGMQRLLLEKIEELTLYIINQDERISQLEAQLEAHPKSE